mgnify:CR=1 FL=1
MFSMIVTRLQGKAGYTPIIHGNSFVQVVSWNEEGDILPEAILTYSQSPEPDSKHYSDLTELYSNEQWIRLPFTDEEIESEETKFLIKKMWKIMDEAGGIGLAAPQISVSKQLAIIKLNDSSNIYPDIESSP